jgi:acyl carrier protein
MSDLQRRLVKVFETVFPRMPKTAIPAASQASVESWDSVAAITLINVIEEEFHIQMDFEDAAELTSFPKILDYLEGRISHTPA